jgi:hypothetical protein
VKAVTDTSLEQQAILAIGWLRKAGRLAAQETIAAEELPQGITQPPREYAKAQAALAHEAVDRLVSHVGGISDKAAEAIKGLQQQRAELAAAAGTGKKTAQAANTQGQALAMQMEGARATIDHAARLLRILHGQEELPLPVLPLYKYAQALARLQGEASAPEAGKTSKESVHHKAAQAFMGRTDRSDRIALSIAVILCATIIATALYYVFFRGTVELQITPMDNGVLRVTCTNTMRDSILLDAPYNGDGLPVENVTHYGVLLELVDKDGKTTRPATQETLWEYKDVPAHLYGPIVIGPMFAAELSLDLKTFTNADGVTAMRLTLFRAPDKKCRSYEVILPEAS